MVDVAEACLEILHSPTPADVHVVYFLAPTCYIHIGGSQLSHSETV